MAPNRLARLMAGHALFTEFHSFNNKSPTKLSLDFGLSEVYADLLFLRFFFYFCNEKNNNNTCMGFVIDLKQKKNCQFKY